MSNRYPQLELSGSRATAIVQELITQVRAKSPSMVFLMETHRSGSRAMNLKWRLGMKNSVGVDSVG
jgi:hypothetical protein